MATAYGSGICSIWVTVPVTQTVGRTALGGGVSGPKIVTASVAAFLGTGEKAPRIIQRRSYSPLHNDISGPIIPFDRIDAGKEAFISVVLTRWNELVLQSIQSTPVPGNFPGVNIPGERGSLVMTEGLGYNLLVRFGNSTKPGMVAAGLVPGRRFLCAVLDGEEVEEPGTDVNKKHLMWYCQAAYIPGTGQLPLYDYNMLGTPPFPPN